MMLKPNPSREGAVELDDDEDEDGRRRDDEDPLFEPDEAGR